MKERNLQLDAIKGGAILLVVLGHSLQVHDVRFDSNLLFRLIYSFHMPLFMAASGWVAKPQEPRRLKQIAIRLGLPTLTWYLIQFFVERGSQSSGIGSYIWSFLKYPDLGLWFLWILLICQFLLSAAYWLEQKIGIISYALVWSVLWLSPSHDFGIQLTRYYFVYFSAAFLVARNFKSLCRMLPVTVALALVTYPVSFLFWHRSLAHGFSATQIHSPEVAIGFLCDHVISAVSGCILFAVSIIFVRPPAALKGLGWLGRRTLEIYVSHQLLVPLVGGTNRLGIFVSFLFAILGSLVIARLAQNSKLLYLVLYGTLGSARPEPYGLDMVSGFPTESTASTASHEG